MAGIDKAPVTPPSDDNFDCVDDDHHYDEDGDDDSITFTF